MSDLSRAVIRRQVDGIKFGIYTDDEVRSRSVIELTSPQAFDSLGTPLPHGLYDPLLGPTESKNTSPCPTCGNLYTNCPGHSGHIELCVPVYQPLTFPKLIQLLRLKCLSCHSFRLEKRLVRIFEAKFHLIDTGRCKEALEFDDLLSTVMKRHANPDEDKAKGNKKVDITAAAASIEGVVREIMQFTPSSKVTLTSHERSVRRQLAKEFISTCNACKKCNNCNAFSPRIRQDNSNKVFQNPLSDKMRKQNVAQKIKIYAALAMQDGDDTMDMNEDSGWDSDDSEIEDSDGEDSDEEPAGISTMSDDEDMDDVGMQRSKRRESSVSTTKKPTTAQGKIAKKASKPDKFMHALEIEAQVRLTWKFQPYICAKIFGDAHCKDGPTDSNGFTVFFMRAIPVPPSRFRPPMIMGTMTVEHAQNHYLNKVLELNDRLRITFATVNGIDSNGMEDSEENGDKSSKAEKDAIQARAISTWIDMQTTINCYIDSSKDPSAASSQNVPNGIRQLLEKKEGIFRKHMMGKRVNFACRSVISPDPYIGTNEIGLPQYFAETLTYPTPVTALNVAEMRRLVIRGPKQYPGARWVELPNGRRIELTKMQQTKREAIAARLLSSNGIAIVGRQLRNGDMVLMNRQPSLHKPSIMAHKVRVLHSPHQKTIRMHYANCNTYNADYDGDEMNCHFPQSDIARAEAECIAKTDLQYIVPTDGSPLRGLIQDHVDAGVKMTSKDTFFKKWEYQQLIFACLSSLSGLELLQSDVDIEMLPPTIRKPRELWTGKQVITTLLHHLRKGKDGDASSKEILPGISVERKSKTPSVAFGEAMNEHLVIIRDGELLRGILDKAAFGSTDHSLVHGVYEAYGPTKAGLLLNALGRLFTAFLQYYAGHSCRMEDLILKKDIDVARRGLVQRSYNRGSRAAKAWADSDGGKVKIPSLDDIPNADKPLKPVEAATTSSKIAELLSGEEGKTNAASLDSYMQSQLNPLASEIIKKCLPNGLEVPFPLNTFSLMVTTGAKGSTVNQSQVSCALGQQALEGRRVPRMSSGRTMPSFAPYDPNPRADGFIADRFLTGVRPQEYYFHCMAGREGLVDTAVKTSRSGYLQRCLVKHLEELKVCYDHTVRDGEGGVVQFLYGEDGIDPMKAAHLDGSSSTLQFMARNHKSFAERNTPLPNSSLSIAEDDVNQVKMLAANDPKIIAKGAFVLARKLKFGKEWKRGCLCRGWHAAKITKVHSNGTFDIKYSSDGSKEKKVPSEVKFDYTGGKFTKAASRTCTIIRPSVRDPILSDFSKGRGGHRIGSSGSCVSEKIASDVAQAIISDDKLKAAMKSNNLSADGFKRVVSAKYGSALCAPGEAVGCIAAQSIGEPSTQMTLNTFHLAGAGANVTLGIPRLREIIMTASRQLKTPTMSVPILDSMSEKQALRLTRYFTRLPLNELIANKDGISVRESLQQNAGGSWERAYYVSLQLHSAERISEAFGLNLEDVAAVVTSTFIPHLSRIMKMELKKSSSEEGASINVVGGESSEFISENPSRKAKETNELEEDDEDDGDEDAVGAEDGVAASRFQGRSEVDAYGEMDEDDRTAQVSANRHESPFSNTDDADSISDVLETSDNINAVKIDRRRNILILRPLRVDPSTRPLLMVGLVDRAAAKTLVRSRPKIDSGFVNDEDGRGRCLQTAGCNFEELWKLRQVDHNRLLSNDIWAVRSFYGVEAARMSIVDQIRGVFAVYGISVDPRHLSLIADYMTYDGGYKAMNRIGMADASSSFLQMSYETTAGFMIDAALNNREEPMESPSANIVLGRPIKHGTGAFECIVKA